MQNTMLQNELYFITWELYFIVWGVAFDHSFRPRSTYQSIFYFSFFFFKKLLSYKNISKPQNWKKKKKKKIWFWRTACVPWALGVNFKVESLLFIKGTSNEPANKRKIKVSRDSYTFCILAIYVLWKSLNHTNIDFNKLSATSKKIIVIMSLNRN